jgi:hypothetical protein
MWACGRVVWSKYERPSIFPFNTHSVLCFGLVAMWDGPEKILLYYFLNECIVMWACGRVVWSKYVRPSIFPLNTRSVLCCGLEAVWDGREKIVLYFFLNEWIVIWACGRVVCSKYERPSIFPFQTLSVLCCWLVTVWDGLKKILLFWFFKSVDSDVGLWPCGMVQI